MTNPSYIPSLIYALAQEARSDENIEIEITSLGRFALGYRHLLQYKGSDTIINVLKKNRLPLKKIYGSG